jgi:hypothetical protein
MRECIVLVAVWFLCCLVLVKRIKIQSVMAMMVVMADGWKLMANGDGSRVESRERRACAALVAFRY